MVQCRRRASGVRRQALSAEAFFEHRNEVKVVAKSGVRLTIAYCLLLFCLADGLKKLKLTPP
jgi:hypothetical protein